MYYLDIHKQILKILHNSKFRAAYDFLMMREKSEDLPTDLCTWWTSIQTLNHEKQKEMIAKLPSQKYKKNIS